MVSKSLVPMWFAAVAIALPAPAMSGGSIKDAPDAPPPAVSFSGAYVGLHVGGGWSDTSVRDDGTLGSLFVPPFGAFACGPALTGNYCGAPLDFDAGGVLGGGQIGFNFRADKLVFGVEGDLGVVDIDKEVQLIRPFQDRDVASIDMDWYVTLTGRLGFVAQNNILIYVKAGAAFADIKYFAADIDLNGATNVYEIYPGSVVSQSGTQTGWTVGGGLEYALNERLSLKAEYLYMDFGSQTATSTEGDRYKFETDMQTVKLGINFAFPRN
jgi:outer membrane immunogenic protein